MRVETLAGINLLPKALKARALLAFLCLAERPVSRA
jgi:hypothetical protein